MNHHYLTATSEAVKGLDLEEIGIEEVLVPKEAEFFCRTTYPKSTKIYFGEIFFILH